MRLGVGGRLFIAWLCSIGIAALIADVLLERETAPYVTEQVQSDLVVRARAAAKEATNHAFAPNELAQWDAVADEEGKILDVRVTFIRKDGTVIGDSEVATDAVAGLENHASRPEVMDALAGKVGSNERKSATIGVPLLYVAIPMEQGGAIAVVRVAKPLAVVEAAISRIHQIIGTAVAFAIAFAAGLSAFIARRLTASLRELTEATRRMAAGEVTARTHVRGNYEIGELGQAIDALAARAGKS